MIMNNPYSPFQTPNPRYAAPPPTEINEDEVGQEFVDDRDYIPSKVTGDELDRLKEEMRLNRVPVTNETIRHAIEAEEIRRHLRSQGVRSVRKVAATRDCTGSVKLTFAEYRYLVEKTWPFGRTPEQALADAEAEGS
jgi:hypothetical protein